MSKKVTYEDKITTLDRYIAHPQGMNDPEILRAVKTDVVKAYSNGAKTSAEKGPERTEDTGNELYNSAMGVYRNFLKERGAYLDMTGRKAAINSEAMRGIIKYVRGFMNSNDKPSDDKNVLLGIEFIFSHWNRLNDYLRNRIELRDINDKIGEILLKIKNGADTKTAAKDDLQRFKQSLTKQ